MSNNGQAYHRSDMTLNYANGHDNTGIVQFREDCRAAEQASAELRDRTLKLFREWEERHGFQKDAGKLLIPAGYIPEERA